MDTLEELAALKARTIMHSPVETLDEEMPVSEAARKLIEGHIQGAPVLGNNGEVVGVLSVTDLARYEREKESDVVQESAYYHIRDVNRHLEIPWGDGFHIETANEPRVKDLMTPSVISVTGETLIAEVLDILLRFHIHRVMVTEPEQNRVIGVITEGCILRVLSEAFNGVSV
jgi:CBS domain-containing protein